MSWIERLVETYDSCGSSIGDLNDRIPLLPICHTMQNAHIEITIDDDGHFLRAKVIEKSDAPTLMPCTEKSGGRAGSKPANHPLCDSLQYIAGDFLEHGGVVTSGFSKEPTFPHDNYMKELKDWVKASPHPSLTSILSYLSNGTVIEDLATSKIIPLTEQKQFVTEWVDDTQSKPVIYAVLPNKAPPQNAFIRWAVETKSNLQSKCHQDPTLWKVWTEYYHSMLSKRGLCNVTGKHTKVADLHPSKLRHAGDKAKLISSNDGSGFTYRGRFTEADQACSIGFDTTQKAHNALRWLIAKQGRRFGDQTIVSWSTQVKDTPNFLVSTFDLLNLDTEGTDSVDPVNTSEAFAKRLGSYISGYGTTISQQGTNRIVILSVDSATPGRMAIRYYRELTASDFLERIQHWHESCAWHQFFGKDKQFVGAPSPRDIAQAAYGKRLDTKDKLLGATVNRLLPCIIDSAQLPRDLVEACVRHACNPLSMEPWERKKTLGIACSLYRKHHHQKNYAMNHEENRNTRDYLYGSLLAIADHIEERALFLGGEKRDTNAMKLMQRFAERPFSTWRNIALALNPYISRLKAKRGSLHTQLTKKLDDTYSRIEASDFQKDTPLSGEFLLGFHTMRKALWDESTQDHSEKSFDKN
jgi:CRISPR-associated protein Csd1